MRVVNRYTVLFMDQWIRWVILIVAEQIAVFGVYEIVTCNNCRAWYWSGAQRTMLVYCGCDWWLMLMSA